MASTQTQEVRTKFVWDTKSVKSGGRDFKVGFSQLLEGERRVKSNISGLISSLGSARSGSDLAAAAIFHLGESFKIGMGGAVGIAAAYAAFNVVQERGVELAKDITDAQMGYVKALGATKYSSSSEDVKSLISERQGLLDVIEKEKETRTKLDPQGGNYFRRAASGIGNFLALGFQGRTKEGELSESRDRELVAKQKLARIENDTLKSMYRELEIEKMRDSGDVVGYARKEIQEKKDREIIEFKRENLGWTKGQIDIINKKYEYQLSVLKKQDELFDAQISSSKKIASINNSIASADSKKIQVEREKVRLQTEQLAIMRENGESETNSEKYATAQQEQEAGAAALHHSEVDQFGGSQRSQSARLRAQRRAQRRYNSREKRYNERGGLLGVHRGMDGKVIGGIDPATGQHVDVQSNKTSLDEEITPFDSASSSWKFGPNGRDLPNHAKSGLTLNQVQPTDFTSHFQQNPPMDSTGSKDDWASKLDTSNNYLSIIANKEGTQ